jgi:hypothetical protein
MRRRFINRWVTWIAFGIFFAAFAILFVKPDNPGREPGPYDPETGELAYVGIMGFEISDVDAEDAESVMERLRYRLRMTNRMELISQRQMDRAAADGPANPVELGLMVGADLLISGSLAYDGRRYTLKASVIDIPDGDVLGESTKSARDVDGLLERPIRELSFALTEIIVER